MTFGLSPESPVLQNLNCSGDEYHFRDCPGYQLGNVTGDYCLSGNYQAGVYCTEVQTTCYSNEEFQLRWLSSEYNHPDYAYSAVLRVDYCYNNTLQGVCDVGWTEEDAAIACRDYFGNDKTRKTHIVAPCYNNKNTFGQE